MPVAEDVFMEYFREIDAAQGVHLTFAEKIDGGGKFLYVYDLLERRGWLPRKPDGDRAMRLSRAHRRWRKRLKKSLKKAGMPVDMDCTTSGKDNGRSDVHRSRGNQRFRVRRYEESLNLYTLSMMTAEIDSVSFALSVANRSAALYYLREYGHCVSDVDRALKSNAYPSQNIHKLFERKGNCYVHMNRKSQALEMYSVCIQDLFYTLQYIIYIYNNDNYMFSTYGKIYFAKRVLNIFLIP